MSEQQPRRYPVICKLHLMFSDTCSTCLAWDRAIREWRDSVITPPQHHPMVTLIRTETWVNQIFNHDPQEK